MQWRTAPVLLSVLLGLSACASNSQAMLADPVAVAREEARLLVPYEARRIVVCSHLRFTVTPNFSTTVSRPALDASFHKRVDSKSEGMREFRWTNTSGTTYPFTFTIKDTEFRVIETATMRILEGRNELTLDTETGGITVVHEGGREAEGRDVAKFMISGGRVQP